MGDWFAQLDRSFPTLTRQSPPGVGGSHVGSPDRFSSRLARCLLSACRLIGTTTRDDFPGMARPAANTGDSLVQTCRFMKGNCHVIASEIIIARLAGPAALWHSRHLDLCEAFIRTLKASDFLAARRMKPFLP